MSRYPANIWKKQSGQSENPIKRAELKTRLILIRPFHRLTAEVNCLRRILRLALGSLKLPFLSS